MRISTTAVALLAGLALTACSTGIENKPGTPTTYQDPDTRGAVSGVGIESQDIISMTDQMMRDMLTNPQLTDDDGTPPRVIIDDAYFENRSSQRIDKQLVVNRLRVGLSRAANGRMVFVGRQYADAVEKERELKRDGVVDSATTGLTQATAGADYRLVGTINSLDARDRSTGTAQRYSQITFEMLDLEYGTIVWSGIYEFSKAAQDDVIYR
ncbi:CsgG/HfaB family protein [Rhodovibrio salinarum]|uniref:Penicillin-binding protein activator LpoB n=1 Tax=Rhodovibrio salinarum TaxID=1087 RepID=A0A934QF36_9PROT|nr:CsgG/HfaB family protein [Rhodovibrio salinarum]MBK1695709.1 penicillin-binding protein activator LpoB [Rhodovibrio salinarum]